jgi:hypothetical protein
LWLDYWHAASTVDPAHVAGVMPGFVSVLHETAAIDITSVSVQHVCRCQTRSIQSANMLSYPSTPVIITLVPVPNDTLCHLRKANSRHSASYVLGIVKVK